MVLNYFGKQYFQKCKKFLKKIQLCSEKLVNSLKTKKNSSVYLLDGFRWLLNNFLALLCKITVLSIFYAVDFFQVFFIYRGVIKIDELKDWYVYAIIEIHWNLS